MKNSIRFATVVLLGALFVLGGCAHQPASVIGDQPGFFKGLLHGFLIFISLVGSLFTDVRIYAFPNSGFWYDLGYFVGASAFLGGSSTAGARRGR